MDICGIVSNSGPNGEPLACGYKPHETGEHSWATLPTFQEQSEYIRKLERVAVSANATLDVWYEFDGDPAACGEYVDALHDSIKVVGEEKISELKFKK